MRIYCHPKPETLNPKDLGILAPEAYEVRAAPGLPEVRAAPGLPAPSSLGAHHSFTVGLMRGFRIRVHAFRSMCVCVCFFCFLRLFFRCLEFGVF